MANFKYSALQNGNVIEGVLSAENHDAAVLQLEKQKLMPLEIKQSRGSKEISFSFGQKKMKKRDLAVFSRQVSTMFRAGLPIIDTLEIYARQTKNKSFAQALRKIADDVQKGFYMSKAMSKFPKYFDAFYTNMISAGEQSGQLDIIFERLAIQYEKETELNRKLANATRYPLIVVGVAVSVLVFILTFVMPTFVEIFSQNNAELPGLTAAVVAMGDFLKNYWYILLGVLIILFFGGRAIQKTKRGHFFIDQLKTRIPGYKHVYIGSKTALFTRTLSTLLASGLDIVEALGQSASVLKNVVFQEQLMKVQDDIKRGHRLSVKLGAISQFPEMLSLMVRIGEESGALDTILDDTALYFEEEVDFALKKFTQMLEPAMLILVAGMVGTIVIAMLLPMFGMFEQIM
jgi:type IV pilus assembly protein PilC